MNAPRVLHVAQPTDAGVAVVALGLLAHQRAAGCDVVLACPPTGMLPDAARAAGHDVRAWDAGREPGPAIVAEVRHLAAVVRAVQPDVVHLHSSKAGLAGRLAVRGRRATVFQPHAWSFLAVGGAKGALATRWERLGARWCDVVLAVSEAERALGEAAGVHAPVRVIPNGVDVHRYAPLSAAARAAARHDLGVGPGPLVVCVGRLCRQKGQDLALDAWPAVRAQHPAATLVLVGDGPDRGSLEARGVAGVSFAGASDAVARWLAVADVVVAPSRWEGQSLALLEALASGASVIAADVAGVREAVPEGGGAVIPVEDATALATEVARRLADPARRTREGLVARAAAETSFSFERTAAATMALYDEVLATRQARPRGAGRAWTRARRPGLPSSP